MTALIFREQCPVCNALVSYQAGKSIRCPHCQNELLIGCSDPTSHQLFEIDADVGNCMFGVFHLNLHPIGTHVCVTCQEIYPVSFECCPQLIDLAFAAYNEPTEDWGPETQQRITDFLISHPIVVANTAKLRILQSRKRKRDPNVGQKIEKTLQELGLSSLVEEITDDL